MEVRPDRQDLALREAEALALRGDHAALSEFLAMPDRRSDVASSGVRFATAIAAMARGQFLAAAAAWDDRYDRQSAPPDQGGAIFRTRGSRRGGLSRTPG